MPNRKKDVQHKAYCWNFRGYKPGASLPKSFLSPILSPRRFGLRWQGGLVLRDHRKEIPSTWLQNALDVFPTIGHPFIAGKVRTGRL